MTRPGRRTSRAGLGTTRTARHARQQRRRVAGRACCDDGGSIINIGSDSGSQPHPGTAPYSAAKAGLRVLTNALTMELRACASTAVIPMGRLAQPGEVAGAVLFLATDQASYITGYDLAVHDGGELPARYLALPSQPT